MRRHTKRLMGVCLIVLSLLAGMISAAAPPGNSDGKQTVKVQKADQTALAQQQVPVVEGMIMGQIPITAKTAFERFELPVAPASRIDHVPLSR
jgi:hypothetical protein